MQILTRLNKVIAYSEYGYTPVGDSAICSKTNECYNNALIVNVDCVPTDIDLYEYYYVNGKLVKGTKKCATEYEVDVVRSNSSGAIFMGILYYTINNGVLHLYGELSVPPKTDTPTENQSLIIRDYNKKFVAPSRTLYTIQPAIRSTTYDDGEPFRDFIHVSLEQDTLTIFNLPTPDVKDHTVHINFMYNIIGTGR